MAKINVFWKFLNIHRSFKLIIGLSIKNIDFSIRTTFLISTMNIILYQKSFVKIPRFSSFQFPQIFKISKFFLIINFWKINKFCKNLEWITHFWILVHFMCFVAAHSTLSGQNKFCSHTYFVMCRIYIFYILSSYVHQDFWICTSTIYNCSTSCVELKKKSKGSSSYWIIRE